MQFSKEDHVRLRDMLANIKGKFLLSYNDCPYIRELYKDFYIEECTRQNNMAMRYDGSSQFNELLISNYDTSDGNEKNMQIDLFNIDSEFDKSEGEKEDERKNI